MKLLNGEAGYCLAKEVPKSWPSYLLTGLFQRAWAKCSTRSKLKFALLSTVMAKFMSSFIIRGNT